MVTHGYKKYMKKDARKGHPLVKIFIISFFGMLLISTFIINSLAKNMTVDTSIGDYKEQPMEELESKKIVDNRLAMIQSEDQDRNFSDIMQNSVDSQKNLNNDYNSTTSQNYSENSSNERNISSQNSLPVTSDTVYKVFIGSYTTSEQAKVAKEIILESGNGLNPIVKCIGSNNYTLQVGIFKNKLSAETMLDTIQKSNLPGRIVQEN